MDMEGHPPREKVGIGTNTTVTVAPSRVLPRDSGLLAAAFPQPAKEPIIRLFVTAFLSAVSAFVLVLPKVNTRLDLKISEDHWRFKSRE